MYFFLKQTCISLYKKYQRVIKNKTYFNMKTLLKPILKINETCLVIIVYIKYCISLVQLNNKKQQKQQRQQINKLHTGFDHNFDTLSRDVSRVCVDVVFNRNKVQDTPMTELKLFLKKKE